MKKYQDFQSAVADKADAKSLATYIVNTIAAYADNDVVPFDSLDSDSVGMFIFLPFLTAMNGDIRHSPIKLHSLIWDI